ncbi:hypothetical protein C9374_013010 [Naegleria lovaniensis]|uniref:Uncharacterized protein n=1 Tax=Naegleria lovaniensis TaxID=51637 RepID=A0AA88KBC1_NAELO|nr:uncharacterized protein C9374_013010 [Naegleria lovaniensis]KAG2372980.1 hypothetical protein C9374_013010 [Naegleria lovaniensis]
MTIKARHRQMLSDFSEMIDLVFECHKKGSSLTLEIIETKESNAQNFLKLKRSNKSGKNETKYKLILQVDQSMMESIPFLPLLFMIELPQKLHGMSLSKITEKIFCPFSERLSVLDGRNLDYIMMNPETYLIEEPSLHLRSVCDDAIYKMKDKSAQYAPEVVIHHREHFLLKEFGFNHSRFYEYGVSLNESNDYIYTDNTDPNGCSFLNATYVIPDRYRYLRLVFEECVEINLPYVNERDSKRGHFKSYIYVRGNVRELEESKTGQTATSNIGIQHLSTWKRLFILSQPRGWINHFKF